MQQYSNVTYTKAVGIILMVWGHSGTISYIYDFIDMFHMPLFFFCAGYCFKESYYSRPVTFVWRRVKGLWWPYVKWSLLFLLLHNLFVRAGFYGVYDDVNWNRLFDKGEMLQHATSIVTAMEGHEILLDPFWFMKALLYGSLIAYCTLLGAHILNKAFGLLLRRLGKTPLDISLAIKSAGGVGILVLLMRCNHIHDTFSALLLTPQHFLAALFFVIGHIFASSNVRRLELPGVLAAFAIVFIGSRFWCTQAYHIFYDNRIILPYIVTAVLGTWMVYSLPWHYMGQRVSKLMHYIGTHTLVILTWHLLCFKLVSLIIVFTYGLPYERLADFHIIAEHATQGWWIVYLFAGVFIPISMSRFIAMWQATLLTFYDKRIHTHQ